MKKTWEDLQQAVTDIIALAQKNGATQVEAAASTDVGLHTTVRMESVESIEFNRDKSIGITVYKGKRKGSASSNDVSNAAIAKAVEAACNIADHAEEDKYAGLAAKEDMATEFPDLDLYHPTAVEPEYAIEIAKECEHSALAYDKRLTNSDGASFSSNQHFGVYGNSYGFLAGYPTTSYSMYCSVIGKENDIMQRSYDYTAARDINDLISAKEIGIKAAKKTVARLGATKIKTTKAPVLFVPEIAKSLFGHFVAAISGGNLYRKTSFLLDSIGQKIFPEIINIYEDPLLKKAMGSTAFDAEGVATKKRDILSDGKLLSYVLGSYSARKLGLKTTGNASGVHNLCVVPGEYGFEDLVKQMDKGLIVTELLGHGVNLTTGDYSHGACGFWVENGEIKHPVEEITIASNLKDMFANVLAIGNDVDCRGNIRVGSVVIAEMTIAGDN